MGNSRVVVCMTTAHLFTLIFPESLCENRKFFMRFDMGNFQVEKPSQMEFTGLCQGPFDWEKLRGKGSSSTLTDEGEECLSANSLGFIEFHIVPPLKSKLLPVFLTVSIFLSALVKKYHWLSDVVNRRYRVPYNFILQAPYTTITDQSICVTNVWVNVTLNLHEKNILLF